ncbi:nuclear transport factor 2 family protein [Agrococcus terreus]|uniref:SnoaL-like domain-containing protein n=1 Tax=Agrococcus terreus TaxID=574649 RepID=A0ABQ2KS99_9MICO|nr:nuclear transport factor 2 family protein [Agrococcus terreus]GGN88637.1 hypothetical protein GCM10010968_24450 [Agrococcus terreus]
MRTPDAAEVEAAVDAIVAAFAATDTERYFAAFAPSASFVFHTEPRRLDDRAAYEALWRSWLAEGWHVIACRSTERLVQPLPGGAVLTHTVDTTVETGAGQESYRERESIVLALDGDRLVAVHEHLSPLPAAAP